MIFFRCASVCVFGGFFDSFLSRGRHVSVPGQSSMYLLVPVSPPSSRGVYTCFTGPIRPCLRSTRRIFLDVVLFVSEGTGSQLYIRTLWSLQPFVLVFVCFLFIRIVALLSPPRATVVAFWAARGVKRGPLRIPPVRIFLVSYRALVGFSTPPPRSSPTFVRFC